MDKDINKTKFFEQSDLRILVGQNEETFFNFPYNENGFDYVINNVNELEKLKVIKL